MTSDIDGRCGSRRLNGARHFAIGAVAVAFSALVLVGCGSSNNNSSTGGSTPLYGGTTPTATSGGTNATTTLTVKKTAGGTSYLTDSSGKTLYEFQADSNGKSNCSGPCVTVWPPLTAHATAGAGVTGAMTTFKRSDGATQVVINGHPLYYYSPDTAPGATSGQGSNQFGGLWYVVSPSGDPITSLK